YEQVLRTEVRVQEHRLEPAQRLRLGEQREGAAALVDVEQRNDETFELLTLCCVLGDPIRPLHLQRRVIERVERLEQATHAGMVLADERPALNQSITDE